MTCCLTSLTLGMTLVLVLWLNKGHGVMPVTLEAIANYLAAVLLLWAAVTCGLSMIPAGIVATGLIVAYLGVYVARPHWMFSQKLIERVELEPEEES